MKTIALLLYRYFGGMAAVKWRWDCKSSGLAYGKWRKNVYISG